jgi:hypothetical protein
MASPSTFLWMDNKVVNLLCFFLTEISFVVRSNKDKAGKFSRIQIDRPVCIKQYNHGLSGTDLFDQYCSYNKTTLRTKKWPMRIITHLLMCTVVNAYIIWNAIEVKSGRIAQKIPLLYFIDMLIQQIMAKYWGQSFNNSPMSNSGVGSVTSKLPSRSSTWLKAPEFRLQGIHTPYYLQCFRGDTDNRSRCMVCHNMTQSRCIECKCGLCIYDAEDLSCRAKFHQCADFTGDL